MRPRQPRQICEECEHRPSYRYDDAFQEHRRLVHERPVPDNSGRSTFSDKDVDESPVEEVVESPVEPEVPKKQSRKK